jgi:hypothetical protein
MWQWVDKFRERIKTRLPRWSAARSQAAGLSFDSRRQTGATDGEGQTNFKAAADDAPPGRRNSNARFWFPGRLSANPNGLRFQSH